MANTGPPDSWEQQADAAADDNAEANDMSAKFFTLNVNAAEFVPSFNFTPPSQTDSKPPVETAENAETPVTNGVPAGDVEEPPEDKKPSTPTAAAEAAATTPTKVPRPQQRPHQPKRPRLAHCGHAHRGRRPRHLPLWPRLPMRSSPRLRRRLPLPRSDVISTPCRRCQRVIGGGSAL
ncbi:protodermal factor 1-like [Nilaparvata lugens]|uniref:protodermal factor 1-like n=1 Tax=Nilaparvata lugens TaxID=108931 RepID=UPI00193D4D37|nr:protodermal factor 1-like [Nilaparvata lugens]